MKSVATNKASLAQEASRISMASRAACCVGDRSAVVSRWSDVGREAGDVGREAGDSAELRGALRAFLSSGPGRGL